MTSVLPGCIPSEAALQSLQKELQDNVFRDVPGFYAKYFEFAALKEIVERKSEIVSNMSANALCLTELGSLERWLDMIHACYSTRYLKYSRFRSDSMSTSNSPFSAAIYLESSDSPAMTGSTHVFGEYHSSGSFDKGEYDSDLLSFCERARHIFKTESARYFLHAFLVHGATLELWVFDRSGAYSSEKLDLAQNPQLLVKTLAGYSVMCDEELGFNTFVKRDLGSHSYVTFDQLHKLYLRPEMIAVPTSMVGLGTTCYAASFSAAEEASMVVKFSWRQDGLPDEVHVLKLARERNVWGVIRNIGAKELVSTAHFRSGLQFDRPFKNRTLSCVATAPLGRPIQEFTSIPELLEVLVDLVKALRSLYVDGRILHRDVAIKNVVITSEATRHSVDSPKGVLIDFDQALDLDNARAVEPMVGSDGFMAIGILFGKPHTYRHDLESLFYMFLWFAIANDHKHDDANEILLGLPKTSRLWKWCSMDFRAVGLAKAADMSTSGFEGLLGEFSIPFLPLQGLAKELHALIFPVRDGKIFLETQMEEETVDRLYRGMADAFGRSALTFPELELIRAYQEMKKAPKTQ